MEHGGVPEALPLPVPTSCVINKHLSTLWSLRPVALTKGEEHMSLSQ